MLIENNKLSEIKYIYSGNLEKLEQEINEYISQGYSIVGNLIVGANGGYIQTIAKIN